MRTFRQLLYLLIIFNLACLFTCGAVWVILTKSSHKKYTADNLDGPTLTQKLYRKLGDDAAFSTDPKLLRADILNLLDLLATIEKGDLGLQNLILTYFQASCYLAGANVFFAGCLIWKIRAMKIPQDWKPSS